MKNMCGIDMCGRDVYRAPLGRMNVSVAHNPGRCPGLRDGAPLALNLLARNSLARNSLARNSLARNSLARNPWALIPPANLRPEGPQSLSPAQRAGLWFAQTSCGLKGRDQRRAHRPPGEILKSLAALEKEITTGMKEKELEGMIS